MAKKPTWWLDAKGVQKAVRKSSIERVGKAALEVEREAKLSMRAGGGVPPVDRSSPGEPPFVQLGILRASIQSAKLEGDEPAYVVGPTKAAAYGKLLEFGTARMAPRPFMFPALLLVIPKFKNLFRNLDLKRFYKAQKRVQAARGGPL